MRVDLSLRCLVEEAVEKSVSLDGADFRKVNLSRANLSGIKASGACFWGADLSGADLSKANLSNSDMRSANLSNVCFETANLYKSNLAGASLSKAIIDGANLSSVTFSCPSLFSLDLMAAETFEFSVYSHLGEVNIDLSSLPLVIQGLNMPIVVMKDHVLIGEVVKKINCYQDMHTHISKFLKRKKII